MNDQLFFDYLIKKVIQELNSLTYSFDAEARKEQIIIVCIATLEDVGYNIISLTKVAKKGRIRTGFFSYHFNDKLDLMIHTLQFLVAKQLDFISSKVILANLHRNN